jgi:hypothetical protein
MAIKSQADQRRAQVMRDQHGREWSGSIEIKSGYPSGVVFPQFAVPRHELVPPQKYLKYPENQPGRVVIDYADWIKDLDDALVSYETRKIQFANAIPGGAQSPQLPQLMGPKPMSSVPVKAMQQGNKWALGLSPIKPPEADSYFPEPVEVTEGQVFSGDVFSQPKEETDIGVLMAQRMEDLEKLAPPELKGFAKTKWLLDQLKQPQEV